MVRRKNRLIAKKKKLLVSLLTFTLGFACLGLVYSLNFVDLASGSKLVPIIQPGNADIFRYRNQILIEQHGNADIFRYRNLMALFIGEPSNTTTKAYLVVRGVNNQIYYRAYNSEVFSWSSWNYLSQGSTNDNPASAIIGNQLHFAVRGLSNDQIWYGYVNLTTGLFSGWTLLNGATMSAPTLTANSTHLCLVVRGLNNLIYYRFYTIATQTWTNWAALPSGATCDSPAATILGNKLHIVVRGIDGYSLWHSAVDLASGAFSGWDLIDGTTQSTPTLAACQSLNNTVLVVRGTNNVIYRNAWTVSDWSGWKALPTGSTCDGIGAAIVDETLNVVVRGIDGNSLWHAFVDLGTGNFTGWTPLDGSTPSKPTQTS